MRLARTILAFAVVLSVAVVAVAQANPAAKDGVRCAKFRAPNMYAGGPQGKVWYGVYVLRGRASCARATRVLKGIAEGKGVVHMGSDSVNTYINYDGYNCDAGQMGAEACHPGHRIVRRPKTVILSLECNRSVSSEGCPVKPQGF